MSRARACLTGLAVLLMSAPLRAAEAAAGGESAEKFLGLPITIWKTINLLLLLGLLVKLMGKPFNAFFRTRRDDLNERLDRAVKDREEALRLAAEMQARLDRLGDEVAEIRRRAAAEGEIEKAAQLAAAEQDAEMLRRSAAEEIERRLELAKAELARAAADIAAGQARELVSKSLGPEDHRRIFEENVKILGRAS
jgi:F-type H+-transporting ATPase subunit b